MKWSSHTHYPIACPNSEDWVQRMFCVLKYKWVDDIPITSFADTTDPMFKIDVFNNNIKFDPTLRPIDPNDNYYNDCRRKARKTMRSVPTNCYGSKVEENWESTKWWLYEVRGDLMYTFDNILYDSVIPNRKENQFWYLILYLKTLVTLIDNPIDIVNVVSYRIIDKINELENNVRLLSARMPGLSVPVSHNVYVGNVTAIRAASTYKDFVTKNIHIDGNFQIKP